MPGHCGCLDDPVPTDGIAVAVRLGADRAEFARSPRFAIPNVDCWTLRVQAGDKGKSRMTCQLLNALSAADSRTGDRFNDCHPRECNSQW